MQPVRRRKKRPNNGIRTVDVYRGNNGFGFTISGQQPCMLSSIVHNSPAERAGLRSGDYLVGVNGQNVSKVSHDDVVRLIGCSNGLLRLQIAEYFYSDSSDDDHVVTMRTKPRHMHKSRSTNSKVNCVVNGTGQQNRVAKVVRDLRTGAMFDNYDVDMPEGEQCWQMPTLPPPRLNGLREQLCFFLSYLGTIEMPKDMQPGSGSQVVRCCVKRMRAEKRPHTGIVMRVHGEGVTLTGTAGAILADFPVNRICYCGSSSEEDRKYLGLVTSAIQQDVDADCAPSSSCHIFAVQSNLADHEKHATKVAAFKMNCTSGSLSDGCFEFPSTSEPVLNAVRSFCLTKEENYPVIDNELLLANSPQPSQAGSTAASSNSDSGIGFRDDCGNQSDRIVMVDVENQRLHIQQLCDDGKTLDIQLGGGRVLDVPSANLQQAFACVNALCPLPGDLSPSTLSPHIGIDPVGASCDQSVFYRLGLVTSFSNEIEPLTYSKSSENLECLTSSSTFDCRSSKSYDNLYEGSDMPCRSPLCVSYESGDVVLNRMWGSLQDLAGQQQPPLWGSLQDLPAQPPLPPPLWGSLQDLPSHHHSQTLTVAAGSEAVDDGHVKDEKEQDGVVGWATSFEKLLEDPKGLEAFTEFVKKEFSQENLIFWQACEVYSESVDVGERRLMARAIYDKHLAEAAAEPVNVDANARQHALHLDTAPSNLFAAAQKQVFNLMKFDTYPRFLKSQLYHQMVRENGKLKKDDRRRKSVLRWARKNKSSNCKGKCDEVELRRNEDTASVTSRNSAASWRESSASQCGNSDNCLVRVVLQDGSTAMVQLHEGESIRAVIEKLLAKRSLHYNAFEVLSIGNGKALKLDENAMTLTGQEVRLEQRVLFRLDLPNRKTVSVKAKLNKTVGQVLRPVLHKYNYSLSNVTVCSMSENEVIEMSVGMSAVDGRRLTVLTRNPNSNNPPSPSPVRTFIRPGASLDEITNKVFEEVLQSKSSAGSSGKSEASSVSSVPLPLARFLRRDSALAKLRLRRAGPPDDLYEGLKRAQRCRLEDQRGTEINFELPDFLKDKENSPQMVRKMRKLRKSSRVEDDRESKEGEVCIEGNAGGGAVSNHPAHDATTLPISKTMSLSDVSKLKEKPTPPPLPPKPKNLKVGNRKIGGSNSSLNASRRAAYLEEPSSSFV